MPSPTARLERVRLLKFGKHASATDVTADAVTQYFLEPRSGMTLGTNQAKLERDLVRGDNEIYASINGVKETSLGFTLELRGINGGAGDSTSAAYTTKAQLGSLLDVVCGVNGNNDSGETTDAADAGSGTTVTMDAATSLSDQNGVLVEGTLSGAYQAREVVGTSGDDVTICRPLTQASGVADTAAENKVAYASASWYLDADNANHTHGFFVAEGDSFTRKVYGAMSNLTIAFGNAEIGTAAFEFTGSNWTDAGNGGTLTFAAQAAGGPIVGTDSEIHLGSDRYDLIETSVDFGLEMTPKADLDSANGLAGYKVIRAMPKITCKFYFNETLFNTLQAENTQDLLLQLGSTAGSCIAFRMPAADAREVVHSVTDGIETIDCVFHGTRPATGNGGMRVHMF